LRRARTAAAIPGWVRAGDVATSLSDAGPDMVLEADDPTD